MNLRLTRYRFFVQIDPKTLEQYYRRPNLRLQVVSYCGQSLSIPVSNFQKYFGHIGLVGHFEVSVTPEGKIHHVVQLN